MCTVIAFIIAAHAKFQFIDWLSKRKLSVIVSCIVNYFPSLSNLGSFSRTSAESNNFRSLPSLMLHQFCHLLSCNFYKRSLQEKSSWVYLYLCGYNIVIR